MKFRTPEIGPETPISTDVFLGAVIRTSPIGELTDGQESAIHMNI